MVDVLPGVTVNVAAQATPSGVSADTGRLFAVGITSRGPVEPTRVTGWTSFRRVFGDRTHFTTLEHPLRAFWAVGGAEVFVGRVVGPAAAQASVVLQDTTPADTLEVTARDPGDHGNDLSVEISHNAETFDLVVFDAGEEVERWRDLADPADAADRLDSSRHIRATDLGSDSADPRPAEGNFDLAGGDDDRANITDAEWEAALARFDADLGPGQVVAPGRESATARTQLVDHAAANNRTAFLDGVRGDGQAELEAIADAIDTRHAALFAPWLSTRIDGRTRTVPAAIVAAGLAARLDGDAPTGHLAPELSRSLLPTIVDVDVDFDDDTHAALNTAGVNLFRTTRHSGVLLRGWRTLSSETAWTQLSQARYIMGLSARLEAKAEQFVFRTIVPATIADYGARLKAVLKADFDAGALYGEDPDDAFNVDTSEDVNPPGEIAEGRLHAVVSAQVAPFAERIVIDVVKTAIA